MERALKAERELSEARQNIKDREDHLHALAPCGHAWGNYKDPNWGTDAYKGEERCEICASGELSEARAALESQVSSLTKMINDAESNARLGREWRKARPTLDAMQEHAEAAESSLREHAEAIVALQDTLRWAMRHTENAFALAGRSERELPDLYKARAALAAPIPALASRLSAERRAERDVVRAARAFVTAGIDKCGGPLRGLIDAVEALAALPASPSSGVIDKTESDVTG